MLKDAFKKEFDAEKAKLDALVQNIRDAYDNASLLKLKEDGTINTEDGKWFKKISDTEKSYKNQLDAIQKLVADKATAGSSTMAIRTTSILRLSLLITLPLLTSML